MVYCGFEGVDVARIGGTEGDGCLYVVFGGVGIFCDVAVALVVLVVAITVFV